MLNLGCGTTIESHPPSDSPVRLGRIRIVVSIPACHAGGRGSIPRFGDFFWRPFRENAFDAFVAHCNYSSDDRSSSLMPSTWRQTCTTKSLPNVNEALQPMWIAHAIQIDLSCATCDTCCAGTANCSVAGTSICQGEVHYHFTQDHH